MMPMCMHQGRNVIHYSTVQLLIIIVAEFFKFSVSCMFSHLLIIFVELIPLISRLNINIPSCPIRLVTASSKEHYLKGLKINRLFHRTYSSLEKTFICISERRACDSTKITMLPYRITQSANKHLSVFLN